MNGDYTAQWDLQSRHETGTRNAEKKMSLVISFVFQMD